MTDPLSAASTLLPDRAREARVEELLLRGLDQYFAGQHELAINVWTRVLFLDRGHARARAYIERARSAIAERQREGEELVHTGTAAFHRGESAAARRLLTSAIERGAATEEALALLDRLDRLEAAPAQQDSGLEWLGPQRHERSQSGPPEIDRSWIGWIAAGVVLGIGAVGVLIALLWTHGEEWLPLGRDTTTAAAVRVIDEPLPVPSASDVWLARAKTLHVKGHLREALTALDSIPPGDALRASADEERAAIQQKLLAIGRAGDENGAPRPTEDNQPR